MKVLNLVDPEKLGGSRRGSMQLSRSQTLEAAGRQTDALKAYRDVLRSRSGCIVACSSGMMTAEYTPQPVSPRAIRDTIPFPAIERAANGRLWATWYAGPSPRGVESSRSYVGVLKHWQSQWHTPTARATPPVGLSTTLIGSKYMKIGSEFDCSPESVVGELSLKALERVEKSRTCDYPHMKLDSSYIAYCKRNHGGIPKKQWFKASSGRIERLGRLVNFGGPYRAPLQESWEAPETDIRECWSQGYLESMANISGGCGAFLVPLGLLYAGPHHPDEMQVNDADLVCFDYSDRKAKSPRVVFWSNEDAVGELIDCQARGGGCWEKLDHSKFTDIIAKDFVEFMTSLRADRSELK
ncbi:MAG: hypothetical protein O3A00_20825 [Planctomycetota bacterium]|nr:hypothetical protein [Planctomycetota bacterium]